MSVREIDSNAVALAGGNQILFTLGQDESNSERYLECNFEDTSTQVRFSSEYSLTNISNMIVGFVLTDLAELNLGTRVILGGDHLLDSMVEEIVDYASGVTKLSANDRYDEESVDAFVGCDLMRLVRSMPSMRRGAVIVITCDFEIDERLDLYNTLHRKGMRVKTLDARRKVINELPALVSRLERLEKLETHSFI